MHRLLMAVALTGFVTGCLPNHTQPRNPIDAAMFAPVAMRVHPIFSQVKDWTGDGRADGIEALIELQDQFGDPTKATGRVVFEMFEYQPYAPDPRGGRLANPWVGDLSAVDSQRQRWNRTSRTYSFQLAMDGIRADRAYVLTATFELTSGGRFFDRMILEPRENRTVSPPSATAPSRKSGD